MSPRAILMTLMAAGACLGQAPGRFSSWSACATCHAGVSRPAAADSALPQSIGPADLWGGSMMAHSSRDPYWQAKVRFESAAAPSKAAIIEDTCHRCHAPMQQYELRATSTRMALDDLNALGREGVGCTVCHQIALDGLGAHESFEANFKINDERLIYGPHANPFANPMIANTRYTPVEAQHIMESALCGSCHTVITPVLDAQEEVKGEFLEQSPFLEWLASRYPGEGKTCQSCHMPVLRDSSGMEVPVSFALRPNGLPFPPTSPRAPFGLHFIAGANVAMLDMLRELSPLDEPQLKLTQDWTRKGIENALALETTAELRDGFLLASVKVTNLTGHKLPSAYPSRRVWLHLTVRDGSGKAVFESGGWDPETGEISAQNGIEPHRRVVTEPWQTIIYESELADLDGNPTVSLLKAASTIKDNRLLPAGFDLSVWRVEGIDANSIRAVGVEDDVDFLPGSDVVRYSIPALGEQPFTVEVEALYQTAKPGHTAGMNPERSLEERRFLDVFSRHRAPVRMAKQELRVQR